MMTVSTPTGMVSRLSVRDYLAIVGLGLTLGLATGMPFFAWVWRIESRVQRMEDTTVTVNVAAANRALESQKIDQVEDKLAAINVEMRAHQVLLDMILNEVQSLPARRTGGD